MRDVTRRTNRRGALADGAAIIAAVSGGAVFAATVGGCEKDTVKSTDSGGYTFDVSAEEALLVEGGAVMKTFGENNGGKPVLIFRKSETEFLVYSSVCTHLGCIVQEPTSIEEDIVCECHASYFSPLDGSVKSGPASSPLKRFPASFDVKENELTIEF